MTADQHCNKRQPGSGCAEGQGHRRTRNPGAAAAIANAIYNATGVRVRGYPITLDKYLAKVLGTG
ncbi:hypothetical protein ABK249_17255 [Neorhizobium sp. Rsf11]|uniref:Aldehyde oxidase/xanthine dehydrogenase second molybdopterin binding domain-containing protein n=1 Tax=Neorhizobium phenanthreniclasticum TaxID=3157917 RepID=A0ABV0M4A0_9HYPH